MTVHKLSTECHFNKSELLIQVGCFVLCYLNNSQIYIKAKTNPAKMVTPETKANKVYEMLEEGCRAFIHVFRQKYLY